MFMRGFAAHVLVLEAGRHVASTDNLSEGHVVAGKSLCHSTRPTAGRDRTV